MAGALATMRAMWAASDLAVRGDGERPIGKSTGGGSSWSIMGPGLPPSYPWNWWQMDMQRMDARAARHVPIVYGCVMANARAVALCAAGHQRISKNGGYTRITTGWLAELLRNPNAYETWPQYVLNSVAEMLFAGESLTLKQYGDDGHTVVALHRVGFGAWSIYVEPQSGTVFYSISRGGNPLIPDEIDYLVPARDVIHYRAHTPRHPLIGESPMTACALAIGINVALSRSQAAFFEQMRRPSGVLSTEEKLTTEQMKELRAAFDEQSRAWDQGGMPILSWGLKYQQLAVNSQDAQVIEAQRMSIEDVCRVYGVPPPIVADLSHANLTNSAELARHWLALGLGSLLENIERTLDKAFALGPADAVEFDTTALLRTDFVARIEGLAKGVAGGIYSPNEARELEGLPPVAGGDMAFLQRQMTPVNLLAELSASEARAKPPPAAGGLDDAEAVYRQLAAEVFA